jgi:hypothetical protein
MVKPTKCSLKGPAYPDYQRPDRWSSTVCTVHTEQVILSDSVTMDRARCAFGHDTLETPYRHSANTLSAAQWLTCPHLHTTCGNRPQHGLDTRTIPTLGQHWQGCIANSRYSYRHCDVCKRWQHEYCFRGHDLRNVATHTHPTLDISGILSHDSRNTT